MNKVHRHKPIDSDICLSIDLSIKMTNAYS